MINGDTNRDIEKQSSQIKTQKQIDVKPRDETERERMTDGTNTEK